MMEKPEDMSALIQTFLGYRDMLVPVLDSLHEFVSTYDGLQQDIKAISQAFEGDVGGKLQQIYDDLAKQAKKGNDLATQIDRFVSQGATYMQEIAALGKSMAELQNSMQSLGELERKADEQLGKLDTLIEEKRKNYNLRELQRSLDSYNTNVQKVSDFVNKDVARVLADNNSRLDGIRSQSDNMMRELQGESQSIEQLLIETRNNNALLTRLVEQQTVDEAYLYTVLDKWAMERKIKLKN